MASIQQRPLNHHETQWKIGWCQVLGKRPREMSISSRPRTWPSVLWQGALAPLQCQAMLCSAHSFLCQRKREPFQYTPNKQVYGLVQGRSRPGLLTMCRLQAGKFILEHFVSCITGFEFGVWQWDCLLFHSNSLSGCLLKTCVVWTEIWGRGRSHLLWNSLPITWSNYCRAKWRESNRKFLSGACSPSPLSQAIVFTWRPTRSFGAKAVITRNMRRRQAEKAREERVRVSFPDVQPSETILNLNYKVNLFLALEIHFSDYN